MTKSNRPFLILDEVTTYKPSPEQLKKDLDFIQKLTMRCDLTRGRVYVSKQELQTLRRLAGISSSRVKLKNRRIHVFTLRDYLAKATAKLEIRAAAMVTQQLAPELTPPPMFSGKYDQQFQRMKSLITPHNSGVIKIAHS